MTSYLNTIAQLSNLDTLTPTAPPCEDWRGTAHAARKASLTSAASQQWIGEDCQRTAGDFELAAIVERATLAALMADNSKWSAWRLLHHPKRAVSMQDAAEAYNEAANFAAQAYTAKNRAHDETLTIELRHTATAQASCYAMEAKDAAKLIVLDESKKWSLSIRRTATSRQAEIERVRSLDKISQNNVMMRDIIARLDDYDLIHYRSAARSATAYALAYAAMATAHWYEYQMAEGISPVDLRFKGFCVSDANAAANQAQALPLITAYNRYEHITIVARARMYEDLAKIAAAASN